MTADALSLFYHGYLDEAATAYAEGRKDDGMIAAARARLARFHMHRAAAKVWPVRPTPVRSVKLGQFNPAATLRGVQSPMVALEQREEQPFPLCKVKRLPGAPRTPTPADGTPRPAPTAPRSPAHDPDSTFGRALKFTLKRPR